MLNKVAVAMSGGVDSSVAAALCVEKYGKDNVFGVTMKLFCYKESNNDDKNCCSSDAVSDAKNICAQLGIPHYVINFEKEFNKYIVNDFIEDYKKGHTPNPCIKCNQLIKFNYLLTKIKDLGADKLATGHYARIKKVKNDLFLFRGLDNNKDQSYFLYGINKDNLKNIIFPLGEISKSETRKIADKLKLKTAKKKESQEICFINGKTEDYLKEKIKKNIGKIINIDGEEITKHDGIFTYTIGQRKGLGGGSKKPMYVVGINSNKNQIVIGEESELYKNEIDIENTNWLTSVEFPFKCSAKIRYRMDDAECLVKNVNNRYLVIFDKPQRAVTKGQSIVFYNKDLVLGGGIIIN